MWPITGLPRRFPMLGPVPLGAVVRSEERENHMSIVAEQYQKLVGVDTHAKSHTLAVVEPVTGAVIAERAFPTTRGGLARALTWADRVAGLVGVLFVVEGIGSYGAGLARLLTGQGRQVVEPSVMPKGPYRGKGKSDVLDAARIARSVAGIDTGQLRRPRSDGGIRTALQVLTGAREAATDERTKRLNILTALLRTFDLGVDARKPLVKSQIVTVSRWRTRVDDDLPVAVCRNEAAKHAARIMALDAELTQNEKTIRELTAAVVPDLLDTIGIGPITAANVLIAWSHPGRVRSEAAFASLAGTCPIPASSGNTTRHRLNRGGDRRLNRSIHTIALTRMRYDANTRAYVEKRTAMGNTKKEILRILKRYITRQLHHQLCAQLAPQHARTAT